MVKKYNFFSDTTASIDAGVSVGDPIYYNNGVWYKATLSTQLPQAVYSDGTPAVATKGVWAYNTSLISKDWLLPFRTYYLGENGGITLIPSSVIIGIAVGGSQLLVDIKYAAATAGGGLESGTGYNAGGTISGAKTANIYKLDLTSESLTTASTTLPAARTNPSSGCASPSAGYVIGGVVGFVEVNSILKLLFASDAISTLAATLSYVSSDACAVASSSSGYSAGGDSSSYGGTISSIQKIVFSTDACSTPTAYLSQTVYRMGPAVSTLSGYIAGGYDNLGGGSYNTIDKLLFSTETRSILSNTLTAAASALSGVSSSSAGYIIGGLGVGGTALQTIHRVLFASDACASIAATLQKAGRAAFSATQSGYVVDVSYAKLSFSTETISTLGVGASVSYSAGFANVTT